jgi:hypothetical protein
VSAEDEKTVPERLRGAADHLERVIAEVLEQDPDRDVSDGQRRIKELRDAAVRAEHELAREAAEEAGPRPLAWTILLQVTAEQNMADNIDFHHWMSNLREVIGARSSFSDRGDGNPWAVGPLNSDRHGHFYRDHYGVQRWDASPYANVWQEIDGIASQAMALVWAAIHLVDPLEREGFKVYHLSAQRTDTVVVFA